MVVCWLRPLLIRSITSSQAVCNTSRCLSCMMPVLRKCMRKEFHIHRRCDLINLGIIPALSSSTHARTLSKWAEYLAILFFVRLGWTAFAASQKRKAIKDAVMYACTAFFVLYHATGKVSGCPRRRAPRTICSAARTGHKCGWSVFDNNVID